MKLNDLKFYVIRNREGKYFRAKGYKGYGDTWVDDPTKARVYSKLGSTRSIVSWFYNTYPDYGIPEVVELSVGAVTVIDETERVEKQKQKKIEEQARYEANRRKDELEQAKKAFERASKKLKELRGEAQ